MTQQMHKEPMVVDSDDSHADPASLIADAPQSPGVIEEGLRPWRLAKSLEALRAQVNAAFPERNKASDGTIGDPAHQSRASDHNPWVVDGASGVVTAMDITHDPSSGCDAGKIVEALRASRDKRIKYVIWNRRIASSAAIGGVTPWTWRSYTGANPHNHHCHLSVKPDKSHFDDTTAWKIKALEESVFAGLVAEPDDIDADVLFALTALGCSDNLGDSHLP